MNRLTSYKVRVSDVRSMDICLANSISPISVSVLKCMTLGAQSN